jgi:DNA polymerase-3 subunit gamma/tau
MITLALKYRPRLLSDLVGQEASVRALTNALRRAKAGGGAIHHQAFLFAGVRGTGKTSTARILARALNCKEGPTPEPCGVCDACQAAEQPDQNMDIVEIDAASRSSVEDARALREQVQTRPAFCRYRVYIIDEVHMLSRSAFDALLKILEEPPAHAVFVLATTELQDVPDTIKSRVQIFPFRLIPTPIIEGRLKWVCQQEQVTWDEGSLRLLAEAGQGSMRDALTTLDRVISAGDGYVGEDMVREQLGIVPAMRIQAILEALLQGDTGAILDQCAGLASLGADWISFWRELMLAFRDRMEADLRRGAAPHEILRWARMLQLLLQRERDLRDTSLPDVVVELALITAAQLPHLAPLDALLKAGSSAAMAAPRPQAMQAPQGNPRPPQPAAQARPAAVAPRPEAAPSRPAAVAPRPEAAPSRPAAVAPRPDAAPSRPAGAAHPGTGGTAASPGSTGTAAPPAQRPALPPPMEAPPPPPAPAPPPVALTPLRDPSNLEHLRKACSEALKQATGGLPRSLGALAHMATDLRFEAGTLHWFFPPNVRNTVQDLEREQANPHLLEALRLILPTLSRLAITFDADNQARPEDALRGDPAFQRLLAETGGEILDIRREV